MCKGQKFFLICMLIINSSYLLYAQQGVRGTAAFLLELSPEARSAGMGDVGVSTAPDIMSQRWNPAKYIFATDEYGISISYVPWLRQITNGINLSYLAGYAKIDDKQVIGASFTYLSLGDVEFLDQNGNSNGTMLMDDYSFDISYSRYLGEYLSGGITLRRVTVPTIENSVQSNIIRHTSSVAGDISFYYTRPLQAWGKETTLSFGTSISNLGSKLKFSDDTEFFLPMNWSLGVTWAVDFDEDNNLASTFEYNRSLVPVVYDADYSVLKAIGKSFGNGFSPAIGIGFEYSFMRTFMLRTGYYNNNNDHNTVFRYFTFGTGIAYERFRIDGAYLVCLDRLTSAISSTFHFTLGYTFGSTK